MPTFKLTLSKPTQEELTRMLSLAKKTGDIRTAVRIQAIFIFAAENRICDTADWLNVSSESIRLWIKKFLLQGPAGLKSRKPSGRKSNLTKTQRNELKELIKQGPKEAGYPGQCWRSPMIQDLIYTKYGVFYSVHYIAQLLKNMGFSYQKARFVSDHLDEAKRLAWVKETWPHIYQLARKKNACIFFGDEASFPQWGTLTYTWAIKGVQPTVKTTGIRKGYKVFGLIDYFTGEFFHKCIEGRFNSASYILFLRELLEKTNKHIILIQDGARYHTSKLTKQFFKEHEHRLTVFQLPSYSPDYNPIEKLWKKIKEKGTHLHYFPTFESLKNKVNQTLMDFEQTPEEVLSLFGFYNRRIAA